MKKTEIPCRIEHSCWALVMWNNQITHSMVSFPFFIVLPRQVVICRGLSESKLQLAFSILQGIMHINGPHLTNWEYDGGG